MYRWYFQRASSSRDRSGGGSTLKSFVVRWSTTLSAAMCAAEERVA